MNKAPLKVAIILQRYFPLIGGIERQQGAIAPLLRAAGVDVHILTKRYPGLPAFEVINGVPVHRFPIPGPRPLASLSFTLAAQMFLMRFKPDVIHAHEVFSPATTAMLGKFLTGSPLVLTPASSGAFSEFKRLKEGEFGATRLNMLRNNVDCWIALSRLIDRELAENGIPAVRRVRVPNGVDTRYFAPVAEDERAMLRSRLNLRGDKVVVWTGRFSPEKRVDLLIEAWKMVLPGLDYPASLVLVGDGVQEAELRRLAGNEESIVFTGPVDDVRPYLQAGDIFALPSDAEGLSVSMLEAIAAGLAVVATDVGAAREMVEDKYTALLTPPGNAYAFKEALFTLLQDDHRREVMQQTAREAIIKKFDIDAICRQVISVYEMTAGGMKKTSAPQTTP